MGDGHNDSDNPKSNLQRKKDKKKGIPQDAPSNGGGGKQHHLKEKYLYTYFDVSKIVLNLEKQPHKTRAKSSLFGPHNPDLDAQLPRPTCSGRVCDEVGLRPDRCALNATLLHAHNVPSCLVQGFVKEL